MRPHLDEIQNRVKLTDALMLAIKQGLTLDDIKHLLNIKARAIKYTEEKTMNDQNEKLKRILKELKQEYNKSTKLGNTDYSEGYREGLRTATRFVEEKINHSLSDNLLNQCQERE